MLAEYMENEFGSVYHPDLQKILNIPLLNRVKFVAENHEIRGLPVGIFFYFLKAAFSDICRRVNEVGLVDKVSCEFQLQGFAQKFQFSYRFFSFIISSFPETYNDCLPAGKGLSGNLFYALHFLVISATFNTVRLSL